VFINLLHNAFYAVHQRAQANGEAYMPEVTLCTHRTADGVEIRIADNGTGIPPSVRSRIFEPFFTTKPTGQGTGLGLSLSYDIITQVHKGTMRFETAEGAGTTFILTLPA
jgi:signal transduction histidine kinase